MKGAATFRAALSLWMLWLWLQFSSGRSVFPFQSMAMAYKHCITLYLFSPLYISLICGSLSFSLWSERLDHWIIFFRSSIDALLHHAQDYTNVAKTGEARRDSRSQSSCSRLKIGYYVFLSPRSEGIEEHFLSYTS